MRYVDELNISDKTWLQTGTQTERRNQVREGNTEAVHVQVHSTGWPKNWRNLFVRLNFTK